MTRYLIRVFLAILLTLGSLGHISGIFTYLYVDEVENLLYDTRVRLSAPRGVDERIVIAAIDEASLEAHGHWPFTRDKLALLVQQMFSYGVAVVGFDMIFAERDESADVDLLRAMASGPEDQAFRERLDQLESSLDRDRIFADGLASGPSILGYYFTSVEGTEHETGVLPMSGFDLHESMMESVFLPHGVGYTSSLPVLMETAYSGGFINNPLIDPDGVVRRASLLQEYNLGVYESLSLAVAATYLDDITLPIFVDSSRWMGDYPPWRGGERGGKPMQIDPQGVVLVPYRGPRGSFPYTTAKDIIDGTVAPTRTMASLSTSGFSTVPSMMSLAEM